MMTSYNITIPKRSALKIMLTARTMYSQLSTFTLQLVFLVLFMGVNNAAWGDTWDGETFTQPSGTGTEAEPYQISSAANLAWLGKQIGAGTAASGKTYGGKYWTITADIDLGGKADFSGVDWTVAIGSTANAFHGFVDGGSHTISNIQITASVVGKRYGLFPVIQGVSKTAKSSVENLTVDGVYMKNTVANSTGYIAPFASYIKWANITNCHSKNVTFTLSNTTTGGSATALYWVGGFAGGLAQGANVTSCTSTGVTMNVNNASKYLGCAGFAAQIVGVAAEKAELTNCSSNNTTMTIATGKTITSGINLSGFVCVQQYADVTGCSANTVKITSNVDIPANGYLAGFAGYVNTYSNFKSSGSKDATITANGKCTTAQFGGFAGYIKGNGATTRTFVQGCTSTNAQINIEKELSGTNYFGGLVGKSESYVTYENDGGKKNTVAGSTISFKCALPATTHVASGIAYTNTYNTIKNLEIKKNGEKVNTISTTGNITSTSNIGGAVGDLNKYGELKGSNVDGINISVAGTCINARIGGLVGYTENYVNIFNNKVETPSIAIKGAINGATYVGGGVGMLNNYCTIDGLYVNGGAITGPTTTGVGVKNNTEFFVGGAVGKQTGSGSAITIATYQNQIRNVAVEGLNINLANFQPATGLMNNHKFIVGGVIGQSVSPQTYKEECGIPENLISKNVKLYAPHAMTSPFVGGFGTPMYSTYSLDANAFNDDVAKSRTGSWVYSGYKLGLSTAVLNNSKVLDYGTATGAANGNVTRNFATSDVTTDGGISYISLDKLKNYNRYYDVEYTSKTVLWWTRSDNNSNYPNSNVEQTIYPQYNATTNGLLSGNSPTYPYTMYFYQGVNHGTAITTDQATNLISGITGTIAHANDETPVTLIISDPQEKVRGFGEHTISVAASNETGISYQWYVDGIASGTGSSITVKPDWRFGKGIVVNASKDGSIVATASYTLKHGVLHTKGSIAATSPLGESEGADYVGMPTAQRGTSDNPYIIDCPEALRQFSWLSTYSSSFYWETLDKQNGGSSYQSAYHFNRAYYEMSDNIDLNNEEFTPISHAGTSDNATMGTYNQNAIFCGHFDGKGYAIKNFKVTWRGGQYNADGNQYFGLFGVVGWGATSPTTPCVIQNLIIDNAQLIHDANNTSFYYNNGTSGNKNNVQLGILAGMVTNNTTIQNVEVRNSKITDENDTQTYNMASKWLAVGGMIGRVQQRYNGTGDLANSVTLQFLSANCDISLTHAAFDGTSPGTPTRYLSVGGVVGTLVTSTAFTSINMPLYTYFTGKVDAPRALIAPCFGSVEYSGNTGTGTGDYWKNYMAKTSGMIEIPYLYYGCYKIQDYSNSTSVEQTITNDYPAVGCISDGTRTITEHNGTHASNFYTSDNYYGEYQGVNYGEYIKTSGEQGNLENEIEREKTELSEISGYFLIFKGNQLQLTKEKPMKLSLFDAAQNATDETHPLKAIANIADDYTYKWYVNGKEVTGETTTELPRTITTSPQLVYVEAYKNGELIATSDAVAIPRSIKDLTADYTPVKKSEFEGDFDGKFTVTPDAAVTAATGYIMSYAWQEWTPDEKGEYTAEEVFNINKEYITSVTKDGNTIAKENYTSAIYSESGYIITYKQVDVTVSISEDEYNALTDAEKSAYVSDGQGSYQKTEQQSYTPVKVGDTKVTPGSWGAVASGFANASGTTSTTTNASDTKTYKCTITATDKTWKDFVNGLTDPSSPYYALKDLYDATLTKELLVKLRATKVVFLHPSANAEIFSGITIPAGSDAELAAGETGELGDQSHPVKTWGKAYSLLDDGMGTTWDDNKIVLVGTSTGNQTWGVRNGGEIRCNKPTSVSDYGLSNMFSNSTDGVAIDNESGIPRYDLYIAKIAASPMGKNVTISGKHDGVDYDAVIESPQLGVTSLKQFMHFYGNTKFEHLTFYGGVRDYDIIMGHYHDLWFGDGLIMKNFVGDPKSSNESSTYGTILGVTTPRLQIFGGMSNDNRFNAHYDAKDGLLDEMLKKTVPNGEKGFTLTFRSGFYSIICVGSRQTSAFGMQGSPNMPIKCTIDVDLDQTWNKAHQLGTMTKATKDSENKRQPDNDKCTPYDIALILAGNHEGAMCADVDINVKSGRIARIVNGSLGAYKEPTFKYNGTNYRYPINTYFGRANILLDPAKSEKNNDTNINKRVIVTELYNGGVGRSLSSETEITMPTMSKNVVVMKGGTIGFPDNPNAGGWNATTYKTFTDKEEIIPGIYGGGAGGANGIGYCNHVSHEDGKICPTHNKDELLPYWSATGDAVLFGTFKQFMDGRATKPFAIHLYNADTKDNADFDLLDTSSEITIEDGVIGSEQKHANIFGAGSGFTSTQFLLTGDKAWPNTQAGNMYGSSKDAVVAKINISGGTVYGNVYGAGRGTDYYYTHNRASTPDWSTKQEKLLSLGQTYGSVITNITGGTIYGNVYGAGYGAAEAKKYNTSDTWGQFAETAYLAGDATVNISDSAQVKSYANAGTTYGGNVYGGGMLAKVEGNTTVNISGKAKIDGNVFGAAQGITNNVAAAKQYISGTTETYMLQHADSAKLFGIVIGNAKLTTAGTPVIYGDLYGGAESAITGGNTTVVLDGGTIGKTSPTAADVTNNTTGGNIYGGGLGSLTTSDQGKVSVAASADVNGSATVKVNKIAYASDVTPYYIYGGGNTACKVGNYTYADLYTVLSRTAQTTVFGAGRGDSTVCDYSTVMIQKFTQPDKDNNLYGYGNVYGGGNMGKVKVMSNVTMYGGTILGEVFGGGNLAIVGTPEKERPTPVDDESVTFYGSKVYVGNKSTKGKNADATTIYGNIYGGGNAANVYGSTEVELNAGFFANDVFGGGNGVLNADNTPATYADVSDSTRVHTRGAAVLWNAKWKDNVWDADGFITTPGSILKWDGTWTGEHRAEFLTGDELSPVFVTNHNIYGGGNKACRVKNIANIEVETGFADQTLITKDIWKNSFQDRDNPHCYVFGGGYGAYTSVGSTLVNVSVAGDWSEWNAEVDDNLAKEGSGFEDGSIVSSGSSSSRGSIDSSSSSSYRKVAGDNDHSMGVYDNVYGIPGFTVLGVLGGGYGGIVLGNTDVTVDGTTFVHRVYGGGYGSLSEYNKLTDSNNIYTSGTGDEVVNYTRDNLGIVLGNTSVKVPGAYTYGDVFGGGAGVESAVESNGVLSAVVSGSSPAGALHDFTEMAKVYGTTDVLVTGTAKVFGSVYGGGDVANVLGTNATNYATAVTVKKAEDSDYSESSDSSDSSESNESSESNSSDGPVIYQDVFAGGSGRTAAECADYKTLGNVTGSTLVSIEGGQVWRDVYGGCAYGTVSGDANVTILGGQIGNNIYGAGFGSLPEGEGQGGATSADVLGNTNITIPASSTASYLWKQISDKEGNKKGLTDDKTSVIPLVDVQKIIAGDAATLSKYAPMASDVFDFDQRLFIGTDSETDAYRDHNIYGGGNTCSKVGTYTDAEGVQTLADNTGKATVDIRHAMFTDNLVPVGSEAKYAYADDEKWSMAALCCYMILGNNEHPQIAVLGGGYGYNTVVGSTDVRVDVGGGATGPGYQAINAVSAEYNDVSLDDKNKYYGGTNGSNGAPRYVLSRMAKMLVVPDASMLYVVGGGMAGKVAGDTKVQVSENTMCYTVFGGGIGIKPTVALANQAAADALDYGQVGGNTEVNISNGIVRGDVFGGGAGIAPLKVDGNGYILADQTAEGTYRDFTNIARVKGKTKVTTNGSATTMAIYGRLYGGGDVANVGTSPAPSEGGETNPAAWTDGDKATINNAEDTTIPYTSEVIINGGNVMKQVFAGGSGVVKAAANDYTKNGAVYGNTRISINNSGEQQPWLWNRIYGGGENGTVYGNTNVQLRGGNFGYNIFGGGWGNVSLPEGEGQGGATSADVKGSANINIVGGAWTVSQIWQPETNTWAPVKNNTTTGEQYSSQYDYEANKFLINHNIYGGGNAACNVGGDTYITMTKGLLAGRTNLGHDYTDSSDNAFFKSTEWKSVYNKIGSSHFCIYGGGYGEKTSVGNTHVDVNITGEHTLQASDSEQSDNVLKSDLSEKFVGGQSLMDIIGGGYQGVVRGATNVNIGGDTYIRRAFGGSYYADITQTNMTITSVNADDIFGGGLMGDIKEVSGTTIDSGKGNVNLTIGSTTVGNSKIFINKNIYGGNDVSGSIYGTINMNVYGGKVYGNIYGAGNGNYLYAFTKSDTQTKVEPDESYTYTENNQTKTINDQVVYVVPAINYKNRELYGDDYFIDGMNSVTSSAKLINIAQFRPKAENAVVNISGNSTTDMLTVLGSVFGGGNTATISKVNTSGTPNVTMNIGNHVNLGGVFMGADGNALFDDKNRNLFETINGINLSEKLDWIGDPTLSSVSTKYVPVEKDKRSGIYKSNLDLYFMPVEMTVQPTLKWNNTDASTDASFSLSDCTIGSFVCGGNRGNMNVMPKADGNIVNYTFPEGLTIINRIVGGCNQANYTITSTGVKHEGGYLLGERTNGEKGYTAPAINLLVKCAFQKPDGEVASWTEGLNVYGGCYETGRINGDVQVDFRSTMLSGLTAADLKHLSDNAETQAIGNVYGAGYGKESYVYGNTKVLIGSKADVAVSHSKSGTSGTLETPETTSITVMSAYGGGQEGNVIGNSFVQVLNGHIGKDVIGGSYAGNLWGSTHVLVGYPKYYTCNTTGIYNLARTDKWNAKETNADGSMAIKDKIYVLKGDIISQDVYDAITNFNAAQTSSSQFTVVISAPENYGYQSDWSDVNITIDQAVYGGGYSVLNGAGGSGNYTVKKFDDDQNMDGSYSASQLSDIFANNGSTTKGYGGNTTVLVWDQPTVSSSVDHISISKQEMTAVTPAEGTNLFGYYYKTTADGVDTYHFIKEEGTYTANASGQCVIDGSDGTIYEYDGEGGVFGDGHFSFAEGFRAGDILGYGFAGTTPNNAKKLNTLQRMDMIRLTDCSMVLLGARDYTAGDISTTPYSISRVGELYMVNEHVALAGSKLAALSTKKSRNYLGLSNNVHYIGAIKSNVAMTDQMYDDQGAPASDNATYRSSKQQFIDDFYNGESGKIGNQGLFQKRNSARAKNMIGISSGFALKVQNVKTTASAEQTFWGPVVGVVEMQLLNVRTGEAGGYVYADNIHHRASEGTDVPATSQANEDFLETSGNFVFPYDASRARYIVDDCFSSGYANIGSSSPAKAMRKAHNATTGVPTDEAHYWYVTGTEYFYNAHITGYTSTGNQTFALDNSDGILRFSNTTPGTTLTLKSIRWRSNHDISDGYSCDLQNTSLDYSLFIGASDSEEMKVAEITAGATGARYDSSTSEYTKLFAADATTATTLNKPLDGTTKGTDDNILINLVDNVNNSTTEYYKAHLSQPCLATIIMTAPVKKLNDAGTEYVAQKGYVDVKEFYTKNGDVYTKVTDGTLSSSTTYYYKYNDEFRSITTEGLYTFNSTNQDYEKASSFNVGSSYGIITDLINTYNIYLTIDYVQGPNATGNIKVENCALPGEYIRISPNDIKVEADVTMAQNGTIWRIGKNSDGTDLTFPYYEYNQEEGKAYEVTAQDSKTETHLLDDIRQITVDSKTNILVPAYYFMNGYGVQYCYTCNSIDDNVFTAPLIDANKLTIHNYHRMLPRTNGQRAKDGNGNDLDLHIDLAAKRHAEENTFAEPRVYLYDDLDLNEFGNFVNAKADAAASAVGSKTYFGENIQFFIMSNITAQAGSKQAGNVIPAYQTVKPTNFNGTLNGMGHVISGLGTNSLLTANAGNIYNLGIHSGTITTGDGGNSNVKYHCCYTWGNKTIYRMNGDAYNGYSDNDWRYGKVAYDLNQYYLDSRYARGAGSSGETSTLSAASYVENLYHNGDYLYAYQYNATTAPEYYRTNSGTDAHYLADYSAQSASTFTYHNANHPIDQARAVGYVAAHDDVAESCSNYQPLLNQVNVYSVVSLDQVSSTLRNDYLFFGQNLNEETATASLGTLPASEGRGGTLPTYLYGGGSHTLNQFTNRVFRAGGYYRSTANSGYYYNSGAYIYDNNITAIDFHGWTNTAYNNGGTDATHVGVEGQDGAVYYAPLKDYGLTTLSTPADGVTRNLLVYADKSDDLTAIYKDFTYDESKAESAIRMHTVVPNSSDGVSKPAAQYLHLVERAKDSDPNNDFCAPVAFSVTKRAWYTRTPSVFNETGNSGWEGICLPFTVNKVEAANNGELTHFYGTAPASTASAADNTTTLHHEYWLRGLTSVDDGAGTYAGKTVGTFSRPGTESGLFTQSTASISNYNYAVNDYFASTYISKSYNRTDNNWYSMSHSYTNYLPLTADIPYIVSFPGNRYYEFDLSNTFYNTIFGYDSRDSRYRPAQSVTYNAYGPDADESITNRATVAINIAKTAAIETTISGTNSYTYHGTYMSTNTTGALNSKDNAFVTTSSDVMPFRTYMTNAAVSPAKGNVTSRASLDNTVYIGGTTAIESIEGTEPDPAHDDQGNSLTVYPIGKGRICTESTIDTTLKVFTPSGQLYRLLDVRQGTATYSGFQPGVYVAGGKKLRVQ